MTPTATSFAPVKAEGLIPVNEVTADGNRKRRTRAIADTLVATMRK
jgi:hypothetical protein